MVISIKYLSVSSLIVLIFSLLCVTGASAQEYVHTHTLTEHTDTVWLTGFRDNSTLISGSSDHTLRAWNVETGEQRWSKDVGDEVYTLAIPSHNPFFVAYGGAGDQGIRMRYISDGSWRDAVGDEWVHDLSFKPNSYILASGNTDGTIDIWDVGNVNNLRHLRTLRGHTDTVDSVAWSPDSTILASAGRDGTLRLWNPDTGVNFTTLRGHTDEIDSLTFSPDGSTLASRSDDDTVRIWDIDTERTLHIIAESSGNHNSVAFHPDGQTLAIGGYQEISLWNPNTGQHITTLTGHTHWIKSVVFSPDGQYFASSSEDTTIRLWRINAPSTPTPTTGVGLIFESQKIEDLGVGGWINGNGNGVAEVGEQIWFIVTVKNTQTVRAQNVRGTLTADNAAIEIVDADVEYGDIGVNEVTPVAFAGPYKSFKLKIPFILTSQDATFTLTLTADNGGPWTIPITISIVNPASIGIAFPDNLISEEAFNPRSIYFILTAVYPQLTGVSDADVHYKDCTITIHIPQNTQPFIFPIKTEGEEALETALDIVIGIADFAAPGISEIITLIQLFADVADFIDDLEALQTLDLNIKLPQLYGFGAGRPNKTIDFIALLQLKTMPPASIDITIKQKYSLGDGLKVNEVEQRRTWFFDGTGAAPAASSLALSDYPPFRLLPLEVQQYLRRQFSFFATATPWKIPDETVIGQNYPNPFNPETWIPYQLAEATNVKLTIYDTNGAVVRRFDVGHRGAGHYTDRSKAVYWDGRNKHGEAVASGVYLYHLSAGEYSNTRKMLILK